MPVVSTIMDPNLGPVLDVLIGFDPNYRSGTPLTLLGYDRVRNYDGSMGEWANRDHTPLVMETGG